MQGVSGLLDSTGRLVKLLRRCYGCQEGRRTTGGEESRWRSNLPAAMSGAIPAIARAGVAGGELGELPGGEVKMMRGLARAGA
jgi:hypothetical protein